MLSKRLWLPLLLVVALLVTACAVPAAAPAGGETTAPAGGEAAPAAGVSEFHSAYPYDVPPAGHFNTWVTGGMGLGIYQALMEPPLFMYLWADGSWMPVAGESWEWADDTTLTVKIVQGAKWSDGSDFTSKDVVDTFTIARLMNQAVWRFLDSVEAVDEYTINFKLSDPSTTVPRRVLRDTAIRASSVMGNGRKRRLIWWPPARPRKIRNGRIWSPNSTNSARKIWLCLVPTRSTQPVSRKHR